MSDRHNFEFTVPGMHCAHCEGKVTVILESVPGVESVAVNLPDKSVRVGIASDAAVTEDTLRSELAAGGYPAA
ncbi:MAG: heavy-metal-associated domain-containing protein [Spirochaetaceae bacterium]|nr:MAG: heavy-metal-associated domain-containing protein [Spirochaetaceae bacterium]